jgi:hypothetical protein
MERQKRKNFRTAMNSMSTGFRIRLQENTEEQRRFKRGKVRKKFYDVQ